MLLGCFMYTAVPSVHSKLADLCLSLAGVSQEPTMQVQVLLCAALSRQHAAGMHCSAKVALFAVMLEMKPKAVSGCQGVCLAQHLM